MIAYLSESFKIREEVFVKEQGVPLENELDSY
ncbi:GNAT family N-acetyltransferase, partial [Staphylococcus devriesei]